MTFRYYLILHLLEVFFRFLPLKCWFIELNLLLCWDMVCVKSHCTAFTSLAHCAWVPQLIWCSVERCVLYRWIGMSHWGIWNGFSDLRVRNASKGSPSKGHFVHLSTRRSQCKILPNLPHWFAIMHIAWHSIEKSRKSSIWGKSNTLEVQSVAD